MDDRTLYVPSHEGENVLPNSPWFHKLLRYAQRKSSRVAIRDVNANIEKTYHDLVSDALAFRNELRRRMSAQTLRDLAENKEVYIGLLAAGGYEYTVGFIAIVALGAAVVPMAAGLPVEEAAYFLSKARCVSLVASTTSEDLAKSIAQFMGEKKNFHIPCISPIASFFQPIPFPASEIVISSNRMLDMNGASAVIFTSGTTGPPKGAVQRRTWLTGNAETDGDFYGIMEQDVVLHTLPVHHASGVGLTFLPFLTAGACIEFRSGSFNTAWTWERWRQGGLTFFSGVPTIYMRMMRYYEENIATQAPRSTRSICCWSQEHSHDALYGATEFGAVIKTDLDTRETPRNSVGRVAEGVCLKLEDDGHLLVKCPYMFSKYLHDEKATSEAHDQDGYKISALDIEREILGLDYVSEVMVVGVEDEEFGQRVAATISLKTDQNTTRKKLSLAELRDDLRSKLTGYKIPTILRVIKGELPKSGTGKVQKKILGPRFFPSNYRDIPEIQVWSKELRARL
ncbi:hypothetical protein N7509_009066 [Penicillium cosmopolitanum]|uniref:AMP-dependent synthetase/ligase domain-containing protein n=1 Tax=Penicillium cosmopolitanum TaxID=1131564 RepID=A0A9X0B3B1_9EURO|nr:uncharacterized protein N7509_009066 [Penicillium cosmopolitanum]KAJ5386525.1 hypothetical protein N7509_009066 [Penicillium cosmopolitanum]